MMETEFLDFLHDHQDHCFKDIKAQHPTYDDLSKHLAAYIVLTPDIQLSSELRQWIADGGFATKSQFNEEQHGDRFRSLLPKDKAFTNGHMFRFLTFVRQGRPRQGGFARVFRKDFDRFHQFLIENPELKHQFAMTLQDRLTDDHHDIYLSVINDFMRENALTLTDTSYLAPEDGRTLEERQLSNIIRHYDSMFI